MITERYLVVGCMVKFVDFMRDCQNLANNGAAQGGLSRFINERIQSIQNPPSDQDDDYLDYITDCSFYTDTNDRFAVISFSHDMMQESEYEWLCVGMHQNQCSVTLEQFENAMKDVKNLPLSCTKGEEVKLYTMQDGCECCN